MWFTAPVGMVVRCVLKRRMAVLVISAIACAIVFGVAFAALAGARRSAAAIDSLGAYSTPEDAFVASPDGEPFDTAAVQSLPEVVGTMYEAYVAMVPPGADGRPDLDLLGTINPYLYVPASGPSGAIDRLRIVEGRDLDPTAPFEVVVVDVELAADRELRVGSHLAMGTFALDQDPFGDQAALPAPGGPEVDLVVVGIARMPVDVQPREEEHTSSFGGTQDMYLSPAFFDAVGNQIVMFGGPVPGSPLAVRLERGRADLDAFRADVAALPDGGQLIVDASDSDAAGSLITARHAIKVETTTLALAALFVGAAGLVMIGQAVVRLAYSSGPDLSVLRSVGMPPRRLMLVAAAPGVLSAIVGAVGAVVVAVALSPLTPIGLARQADLDPGVHADALVLGVGGILVAGVGVVLALVGGRRAESVAGPIAGVRRAGAPLADLLAGWGVPLAAVLGARFAAGAGSSSRTSLRSAAASLIVAFVAVVTVATLTASVDELRSNPAQQGASWDLAMGNINLGDYSADDIARLEHDPHIRGVAAVAAPQGSGEVNGRPTAVAGFEPASDGVGPPVLEGRLPVQAGEVALGDRTAADLDVEVGDRVTLSYAGSSHHDVVVGTVLVGPGITPGMLIGDGALVSIDEMQELSEGQPINFLLADAAPGVPVHEAIDALRPEWGQNVDVPVQALDVANLHRVRKIPVELALAIALTALVLEGAALAGSTRRRRGALATLRAIGASSRQLAAVLAWQAAWLYLVAAAIGVPLGIVSGRLVWRFVAGGIGALTTATMPPLALIAVIVLGLAASIVLGLAPGLRLHRRDTMRVLRVE